ncbi:Small subunit (SSU) processome component [Quaeritorhiza haematococci]|nr:Small subunit (SSU) processome component [Quaeritorhiza haematococci]
MATAGLDSQLKIWDIRKFKPVHEYFTHTPAGSLDISQMGLLAVGYGGHVNIWKDALKIKAKSPYLTHLVPSSTITDLAFCPFEDVLAYGHDAGVATMIVPGSGEPNFDSLEVNPYQTKKQRRETEVHSLLDKLQPEMITLDPNVIGSVDRDLKDVINEERALAFEANNPSEKWQPRHKARGKSSALRRYLRKQSNVIDPKKEMLRKKLEMKQKMIAEKRKRARGEETEEQWTALQTFKKKKDL